MPNTLDIFCLQLRLYGHVTYLSIILVPYLQLAKEATRRLQATNLKSAIFLVPQHNNNVAGCVWHTFGEKWSLNFIVAVRQSLSQVTPQSCQSLSSFFHAIKSPFMDKRPCRGRGEHVSTLCLNALRSSVRPPSLLPFLLYYLLEVIHCLKSILQLLFTIDTLP